MEIAVIGIACRFPGANDHHAFWANIAERKASISVVPSDRWDWAAYWGDPRTEVNKSLSKWGGFIECVDAFDNQFFGLLPKVVQTMDPQQRIMLELAWTCLEDAGIPPSQLRGRKVGVIIGVFNHDYKELQERGESHIEAHHSTGTATAVIANRVSHYFDFRGPSIPIDTACSSSLNAIHSAIQAIEYGDCEMALAGGINLLLTPTRHISFSKMGMLSPTGTCKTFDDSADGYVRGEGAAVLLLKPLEKAVADGDSIYGVIKGSAVNHCGETYTLTYPSPRAQADVIVAAHERAGVPVNSVGYIEAHGTGTPKGDPIEFEGLLTAFRTLAERQDVSLDSGFCGVSSVKTNIGHLEAAAGVAGAIKVMMAFRHRQLPALHNFSKLNAKISIEGTPFYMLGETREWVQADPSAPRRAGVSSFGFGGTNAHIVLEEPPRAAPVRASRAKAAASVFALSGKTPDALLQRQKDLLAWLRADAGSTALADISAASLVGRDHFAYRFACVATQPQELMEALERSIAAGAVPVKDREPVDAQKVEHGQALIAAFAAKSAPTGAKRREALDTLAALYELGAELSWEPMVRQPRGQFAKLPTYPFARDRFWIARGDGVAAETVSPSPGRIHPALHARASATDALGYASTFDGSEFFLADHVIGGRPVLPGVVYLEMVRAAVAEALGAGAKPGAMRLGQIVWLRPLDYANAPLSARVELSAASGDALRSAGRATFRVTDAAGEVLYCHGEVDLSAQAKDETFEPVAAGAGTSLSGDECYRRFADLGMRYGPAQQALRGLHLNARECIADLALPPHLAADRDAFVVHPSLADAALQAAVVFVAGFAGDAGQGSTAAMVPFALDRLDVLGACPSAMRARVRYATGAAAGKVDIDVVDANEPGRVCLAFRGLSVRPLGGSAAATATPQASVSAPPAELAGSLYVPRWSARPLDEDEGPGIDHLLVVGDEADVAWLTTQLRASDRFAATRIERLCFGAQRALDGPDLLRVRAGDAEDHEAAVAALQARGAVLDRVLWIAPRAAPESFAERVDTGARSVFALSRAMMRGTRSARFVHLIADDARRPEAQGLSGFYKTLRIEKPSYVGRVVQVDAASADADRLASIVAREFHSSDKDIDASYVDGVRSVREFVAAEASAAAAGANAAPTANIRKGGTYLITGGMGALGLIFARHLCERYQATVYLTGRSAPTDEHRRKLDELSALGGHADFLVCDVSVQDDVRRAIGQIRAAGHRLNGILHSAGVIEDGFILRKDAASFARVIAPKTLGTWHLDAETRDEPLDFFALFSSVTGVLGNIGQCDYGFGNSFEDYFAHQREDLRRNGERNGRALSINWPYWKEGGMRLTDKEEEILRRSFGIVPLLTREGIDIFEYGLTQPSVQVVVMPGDAERVHEVLGVAKTAIPAPSPSVATATAAGSAMGLATGSANWSGAIARHLSELFAAQLQISPNFEADRSFREYGFDSVVMIDMVNLLEKTFGHLPKTLFFEQQTLSDLTAYLIEQSPDACRAIAEPGAASAGPVSAAAASAAPAETFASVPAKLSAAPNVRTAPVEHDDIAIIGLSGRYPMAENLEAFWENLKLGRDCVQEIPADRWDIANLFQPGAPEQGKSYSKWGGFLPGVDQFDPLFFNISPKEAENMDPNERLFLETAALAIEDAGYVPDKLAAAQGARENPVGVYVGVMWGDYQLHGVEGPSNTWTTPHSFYWAVANRVSHFFNFSGPSITIDTACSSSLTAIHLACGAIRSGEIDVAIAGGVNLSLHPNKYNLLSDMRFLSSDGRCRSFGEGGDGYVPGEGVGAVLLKPVSRARADGDHVYGIIRGTSVNHGGKTSGFTVPSSKRQAALVQDALQAANVDPRHISYLEAHGTGTSLGDPIEINGLNKAFAQHGPAQYCAIGSVKSNVGHLEAAAGVAGLSKVLLQMKHRMLVPSIQSEVLNPYIEFRNGPFRVQRELQEWRRPQLDVTDADGRVRRVELPRIAGISSFGAGGSNAHLIIEEYVAPVTADDGRPALIVLSARKEGALKAMAANLAAFIGANRDVSLQDAAYTLQIGRVAMEHRIAIVASRGDDAIAALRAYLDGRGHADLFAGHRENAKRVAAAPPVADWLAQGDLPRLAEAWANGHAIDWLRLHATHARRRVPLPGYVYQRQRYWVEQIAAPAAVASLHPLIDANVSTLDEQTFRKAFRPEEFFLRDHQLGSNRILPGVAYLEMALAAGRLAVGGAADAAPRALRDVRWLKPIVVNDGAAAFDIGLLPDEDGIQFEIYQAQGENRHVYAQGWLDADAAEPSAVEQGAIDLPAIVSRCRVQERDAIDAAFAQMGFHFGPSFQVFERLHYNAEEALARLSVPAQAGAAATAGFALPPSLLDGAVRTALGIGGLGVESRGVQVPVRLHRIELLRPIADTCFAHARRRAQEAGPAGQRGYDIDLLDATGQVLARIEQLTIQPAPHLGLTRSSKALPVRAASTAPSSQTAAHAAQQQALYDAVLAHLIDLLSKVTKVPADQIAPKSALENYGIDSVMILALNESLQKTFGELPKTLFYEYQEAHSLAMYFVEQHTERAREVLLPAAAAAAAVRPATAVATAPSVSAQPAHGEPLPLQSALVEHLIRLLSDVTKVPLDQIDPKAPLGDYGIDSVMILALTDKLQATFGEVPKTLFYEYQDLSSLSEYFLDGHAGQVRDLAIASLARRTVPAPAPETAAVAVETPDVPADTETEIVVQVRAWLHQRLQQALGDEGRQYGETTPLAQWPIDPVANARLVHALRREFDGIDADAVYRYETLDDWARALHRAAPELAGRVAADAVAADAEAVAVEPWNESPAIAARPTGRAPGLSRFARRGGTGPADVQDIAIVGLSGRYPGARDVEEFWQNLSVGRDGVSEIPRSRWNHQKHFNPDRNAKGQVYSKWGGFLDGIDQFDAGFFSISPREAEITDPQERLFLQTAWECLEDACYTRQALKDRDVGVFVGVMWAHYEFIDVTDEQRQYGRPMALLSSIANRVSYFLNLSGPSVALDTMCSSSLTALHLACQSIRNGDCQMAIAGGVNLIVHPVKYHLLSQGQFLSSDGRCRAFGDGGDGYVPGEGVGAVLLKPLRQAIEDGDQIHGVIKATAINHGGKTNGYTVPNQVAQSNVIGKALRRAGWHPGSIDYIEAHGTGTSLGDPIEIAGLSKAFASVAQEADKQTRDAGGLVPQSCRIGSVKTNIGHLESAAGIAGLTKILLQMRHRRIAPSLHSNTLNANIDFDKTPFRVVQALEDWNASHRAGSGGRSAPRRAALSSFGAGGSNAHVLIEEHVVPVAAPLSTTQPALFVLSADSEERLTLYIDSVLEFLRKARAGDRTDHRTLDLRSLAYSSLVGREAMNERLAVVTSSLDDLAEALAQYRKGVVVGHLQRGTVRRHNEKLDAILDDAQRDALVRNLAQSGRLSQLAKAWVSMLDVEWDRYADLLFADATATSGAAAPRRSASVRRLSFPTTPFLTRRHWVEQKPEEIEGARQDALHPLLDRNESTLARQRYAKRLTGQEFYLRDHIVDTGEPRVILPGVAYLEMARAAGELAMGEEWTVGGIRNLIWIQPVEVKNGPEDVTVDLVQADDAVEFEIARTATQEASVEGELVYRRRDEVAADEWIDLAALRARSVIEEDLRPIYDGFRRMGFLFGPSFQVTHTRYRMPGAALSRLQLPAFLRQELSSFTLHPSLFDGALRTCLGIGTEPMDATVPIVPFALGELEIRHPLTEECYAYATEAESVAGESLDAVPGTSLRKYDIVVADADGRVLIKLRDFSARALVKAEPLPAHSLQYYGYDWVDTPVAASASPVLADRAVLVIADDAALATALRDRLSTATQVVLAQAHDRFEVVDESHYRFDPGNADSQLALIAHLADRGLRPAAIVHSLRDAKDFSTCVERGDIAGLQRGVQSVRHVFNALERAMPGQSVRFVYAYQAGREALQPQHDAVSGYAKSLLTLNHRFELFTVRTDRIEADALAAALHGELEASGSQTGLEIAHWSGRRYVRALRPHDVAAAAGEALPFKPRGAYLITGGAGKLGLVVAAYLAREYQARLLLTGRSPRLREDVQVALDALHEAGADVHYLAADIAQPGQAEEVLAFARSAWGRLDGVLHCAGVGSDTPITQLDDVGFAELIGPKLEGLIALDRVTADEPLDVFVNFSSVSAMLGDLGSGAYAVANRFMDSHAVWRDALRKQGRRNGKTVSIGWPLWAAGGMEISDRDASVFGFSGMTALSEAEGLDAFERVLRGDTPQVLVAVGDAAKIARTLRVHGPARAAAAPKAGAAVAARTVDAPKPVPLKTAPVALASPVVAAAPRTAVAGNAGPSNDLQRRAESYLKERLAVVVKADAADIGSNTTFEQLGMDSVMLMELRDGLARDFAGLPKTVLFEYDTPSRLAQYLIQQHADAARACLGEPADAAAPAPAADVIAADAVPKSAPVATARVPAVLPQPGKRRVAGAAGPAPAADDAVAIIGLAGQFPEAADLYEFWDNLQQARDCLSPIPGERWSAAAANHRDARRAYFSKGGFLRDVDRFDPGLFRMPLSEAAKLDPQLRVLLRAAWHAVEDAAYTTDALSSERVGVYVGAMNEDFTWIMADLYARTGVYPGPGSVVSELANRVSFLMNFRGPSLTVSTACSSSLTAVHLARQAILAGECEMALAGGVNLSLHPSKYLMLQDMKVLSPDGLERTFDDAANGLVPSEGVGVVVLKRLSRAVADGDRIYGVIRGSSISHAGTGAGQYLPNLKMLEDTVARSLRESGVSADELTYLESHGTGTELGDPIELKALANALRQSTSAERFCAIGTKANLGHMEAASGVCSLIKVLLSMKHGRLSPCARLSSVNASFDHESSPFHFPREAQPWAANARGTRAAGINSFGMGGSNAFVVVESLADATAARATGSARNEPSIVVLSARNEERLRAYATSLIGFLERHADALDGNAAFADLAYSSQVGRTAFDHRLAIVAASRSELSTKIAAYLKAGARADAGVFVGNGRSPDGLTDLLAGDAGREFIGALLQSRQWDKIASIWTRGCAIDWMQVHAGARRYRAAFPAYPFESLRCDLHEAIGLDLKQLPAAPPVEAALPESSVAQAVEPTVLADEWFSVDAAAIDGAADADGAGEDEAIVGDGDELAKQYWLDYLRGIGDTSFVLAPAVLPDHAEETADPDAHDELPLHSVSDSIGPELTRALQHCTQAHRIEVETLIAAAWAVLVNRYTKARCSQFGVLRTFASVPGAASEGEDAAEQVRNLVPLRVCTISREKIGGWLGGLQRNLNRKHAYAHVPIHRIESWTGIEHLFDSVIAFEKTGLAQAEVQRPSDAGRPPLASGIFSSQTRVAMELAVTVHLDAVELSLIYKSAQAEDDKIRTLLEHFQVLLAGLAANPEKNPAALAMRTKRESRETFWKTLDKVNQ